MVTWAPLADAVSAILPSPFCRCNSVEMIVLEDDERIAIGGAPVPFVESATNDRMPSLVS